MLARREPVTLRSVASAAGVSTMAVYTYFDGMPGLWESVRQEGFTRLGDRIAAVKPARDPVRYLAGLGVAYVENALANPNLYRVMFESNFDLRDADAAASTFELLVLGVDAAKRAHRFYAAIDANDLAVRLWADGHGITSLAVTGVLPRADLPRHAIANSVALFIAAGDRRDLAERSLAAAWRGSVVGAEVAS